ncbi:hypothetical protein KR009_004650 [Drosophila setifemur]|nr:hypothetical protein KR009_004650 [Drosophila setifemur]
MPINCAFNLSRAEAIYYTGEHISGSLTITIAGKKPYRIEAVCIALLGETLVHWKESRPVEPTKIEHNDSSRSLACAQVDYKGKKVHINQKKNLTDGPCLLTGTLELGEFGFHLPENLPSTCRVPLGTVEYTLKVEVERRGKYSKCFEQRLVIKRSLEFSHLGHQFKDSPQLRLTLPRSIFVPGQNVSYEVQSKKRESNTLTRLCQCINYRSQSPEEKTKTVIRTLSHCSDLKNKLRLPLTSPIMTYGCDSKEPINISYYVESVNHFAPPIKLPLFVATIAPPVESFLELSPLCFVNLALSESVLLGPINELLGHSCSRDIGALGTNKNCERIKLLNASTRKQSYVQLALRYFSKKVLP